MDTDAAGTLGGVRVPIQSGTKHSVHLISKGNGRVGLAPLEIGNTLAQWHVPSHLEAWVSEA